MAIVYLRIISWSGPLYMVNYIAINFIRNDGNPTLTMKATLTETLSVILIDWFFIFGMGLKLEGAALAVLFSPAMTVIPSTRMSASFIFAKFLMLSFIQHLFIHTKSK